MLNHPVKSCSVRVLRSHDYCHFEIKIDSNSETQITVEQVDELRKTAARLADKAVEQYKVAKENAQRMCDDVYSKARLNARAEEAEKVAEADRTPEDKAAIKALADYRHRSRYDYEDDWQEQDDDEEF